jgi:hypothetical protein
MADPKHISFHLGIGTYDPNLYPTAAVLISPPDDANSMFDLAATLGYVATPALIDGAVTYEAVVDLFHDAARALMDGGGSCLISFSGHGTEFKHPNAKSRQAVCLADAAMSNDVIAGLLSGFPEDALVLFVKDCCHAASKGGIVPPGMEMFDEEMFEEEMFDRRIRWGKPKMTDSPTGDPPKVAKDLETQFANFDRSQIKARVAAFQACRHDQVTFDGEELGKLGVYTQKFIDAVKGGAKTIGDVKDKIPTLRPKIPDCDPQFADLPDDSVLGESLHHEQPALTSSSHHSQKA